MTFDLEQAIAQSKQLQQQKEESDKEALIQQVMAEWEQRIDELMDMVAGMLPYGDTNLMTELEMEPELLRNDSLAQGDLKKPCPTLGFSLDNLYCLVTEGRGRCINLEVFTFEDKCIASARCHSSVEFLSALGDAQEKHASLIKAEEAESLKQQKLAADRAEKEQKLSQLVLEHEDRMRQIEAEGMKLESKVLAEEKQLQEIDAAFDGEVEKIIASEKENQWQWPDGQSIILYKWTWCSGSARDEDDHYIDYSNGWSLTDETEDGYIQFLPTVDFDHTNAWSQKPQVKISRARKLKILPSSYPVVEMVRFKSVEDLPFELKFNEYKWIYYFMVEASYVHKELSGGRVSVGNDIRLVDEVKYIQRFDDEAVYKSLDMSFDFLGDSREIYQRSMLCKLDIVPIPEIRKLV